MNGIYNQHILVPINPWFMKNCTVKFSLLFVSLMFTYMVKFWKLTHRPFKESILAACFAASWASGKQLLFAFILDECKHKVLRVQAAFIQTMPVGVYIQGVQEKLVFFTIHSYPFLAYIAVRYLQSSQRNASVQSLLLAGNFLYNQKQPSAGEGEVANFREFLGKTKQYLMNTLYLT